MIPHYRTFFCIESGSAATFPEPMATISDAVAIFLK